MQNIQFGLSVPLTEALESVERWRVVQAALPHVLHCAAALLHNRYVPNNKSIERKYVQKL